MRNALMAVIALLAAGAAAAQAGFVDRFKAATAAYQAKDYARMEAELREALKLRPGHPTATFNLGSALALGGKPEAAVETLGQLADQKLYFDPAADADFDSLKERKDFMALRRAFARNLEPRGDAARAFRLRSPTYIAEGLAYDGERRHFYVGSVHERRIVRVLRDDTEVDFVKPDAGLWSVLGMSTDRKRDLLWVATAALPEMQGAKAEELGRSAMVAFQLKSGAQRHRFVLDDGKPHALGDVIARRNGTIYTSDSRGGLLYTLDPGDGPDHGKFKALTRPGELASPQGMALSRDERHLYVADYTQGLFRYDLEAGKLERLEVAPGICVYGIDGLYRVGDAALVAIQNGVRPHRVVRLELERRGRKVARMRVLAANLKAFDEPTLGAVVGNDFYFVANSQWNKFRDDHTLPPPDQLMRPQILRIAIGDERAAAEAFEPEPRQTPARGPLPTPCVPPLC